MRQTISVLTATCILALSLPAWAAYADRESQLRARCVVHSLPQEVRACATHSLMQLQPTPHHRRALPLNRTLQAAQTWLHRHGQNLVSILHTPPLVPAQWLHTAWSPEHIAPSFDTTTVQRHLQVWLQKHPEISEPA